MSITISHISKTFNGFAALHDVGLEIRKGELVALLGPSGSGKTTLLRIIAGLDIPDPNPAASLSFSGKAVDFASPAERQVGFVFQHYALFRTMTVFENIAFGLRVRPSNARPSGEQIAARVNELLRLIQLDNLANRYPSQLSGGQRQRVALARALAIEPRILLLDEPFGALDAKVRQDLRRWLRDLHSKVPVTSVLVTHDQEEALEVADRVVIMNSGRIEQVGTPDEVFHHPASAFVMDFLGNVNLFHARAESAGSPSKIRVRPHDLELTHKRVNHDAVRGTVRRIQTASPLVKIEVWTDDEQTVLVEMPHDRFGAAGVKLDDVVYLRVKEARAFLEDYSI